MRSALITISILTVIACSTDDATNPPDNGPFSGISYLRATVGTTTFLCNTSAEPTKEVSPSASVLKNANGTYHLVISGDYYAFQQHISMNINGDVSTAANTSYPIGKVVIDPQFTFVVGYNIGGPTSGTYLPDIENAGTFTVAVFDTTRKRIMGTYSANLKMAGGADSLSVSNGTYEIAY